MARATFNGTVIAESDQTVVLEGNDYFPPDSLNTDFVRESTNTSFCPHKGTASYYDVVVDGKTAEGAVWYYPAVNGDYAKDIEGHYAFWNGVTVEA
ncbi:MAG: DUF427 domain-containing protein [Planctomycetota bacterium]